MKSSFVLMLIVYCIGVLMGYVIVHYISTPLPLDFNPSFPIEENISDKLNFSRQIMANNVAVSIKITLLGCLSLGILGGFFLLYNGIMHGFYFSIAFQSLGITEFAACLLPHSFEIIGLVMSAHLGVILSQKLLLHSSEKTWKGVLIYCLFILTVLFVSSILEVYVSMD